MALFNGGEDYHELPHQTPSFNRRSSIPHLFPDRLVEISVQKVLELLLKSGEIIEQHNCEDNPSVLLDNHSLPTEYYYSQKLRKLTESQIQRKPSNKRIESFRGERRYLTKVLVSDVMDVLAEASRMVIFNKGFQFLFMVLCNERTNRFVIHSEDEEASQKMQDFWGTERGTSLASKGLKRLVNVQCLVLQKVCTDSMIFIIADHCQRLVHLDISYSERVTGIGILGLCGLKNSAGCKNLRDLIFKHGENCDVVVPKVIACLLRYLENLEVMDVQNLHQGIEYYYRGQGNDHYRPKAERIRPLNLIYYTGCEKLLDVIEICPKLRTLKLEASESLQSVGSVLASRKILLEHITLIWDAKNTYLVGLKGFLQEYGFQIENLELETPTALFTGQDFVDISTYCPHLESLSITHLKMDPEGEPSQLQNKTLFSFLTTLKITKIQQASDVLRDTLQNVLTHAPELERLHLFFESNAYFFSDIFLDDILSLNPLLLLKEFVVSQSSLTLISALKLVSTKSKLQLLGNILQWDVEPGELHTFTQILRKAKALNLLNDISIC